MLKVVKKVWHAVCNQVFNGSTIRKRTEGSDRKANGASPMNGLIKLADVDFAASLSIAICSLSAVLYVLAAGLGGV